VGERICLKIITWNCNGAFRKKYHTLEEFGADLLVIQECEDPARSTEKYAEWAGACLWVGGNKNRGLGVFPRNGTELRQLDWPDDNLQRFLPCRVNDSLTLLAVWTMQANLPTFQYIGQLWKYLQLNKEKMGEGNIVVCGDWNSNVVWDKYDRWWNHSDVVRELVELDIHSMYHQVTGEEQGKESAPTLYLHRKRGRPYHIDYAFVSKILLERCTIEVGEPDHWLEVSDHMPLVFEVFPSLNSLAITSEE
jgi:exonuclease III